MASTDATAIPVKNQAFRVTFPITTSAGALVAGATGLDSEVSKDAGTFTDCTNEATQIATSSGIYYLDLTASEMNADTVAVIVKSTEGLTVPIILYPQEAGDIKVNATQINGSSTAASNLGVSAATMKTGTIDTTAVATTTTSFESDDVTDAQADLYVGRLICFTSGTLTNLYCRITDYAVNGGRGAFTVTTLPTAPSNNDTFVIV